METEEAKVNEDVKAVDESEPDNIWDKVLDTETKPFRLDVAEAFAKAVIGETDANNVTNV